MKFAFISTLAGVMLYGAQPSIDFKGQAFDLKKLNPVYVEEYQGDKTCYRDLGGREIVERKLDFSKSVTKPDYVLKDLRDGYEEGAELKGGEVHVFCRVSTNSPLKEKTLQVPEPFVIDGGFNAFLKQNWDGLIAGKRVHFNFVAPSQLDYFAFIAHQCDSSATTRTFSIELDNFVLRLLVPPILVTYNSSTRMMTQYQGISNINDAKGKSLKVKLVYSGKGP